MPATTYPLQLKAESSDTGRRLDQFLVSHIPDVSRARMQQVIEHGLVLVNDNIEKPSYKLRTGDSVTVTGPAKRPPLRAIAEDIPLEVIYDDPDLAVINKPAGMMVHAGAGATEDERNRGTLVNALLHRFGALSETGGDLRPGIVHRLDRDTSGLIIVAKNDLAHRKLATQFASRVVKKRYIALVHGFLKQDTGTIEAAISRDAVRRTRMTTRRGGGREAVSHWKVLKPISGPYGQFTLVEVKIDTGRTHQIRVHLSSIGHPIVGDTLYGAPRELKPASQNRHASRGVKPAPVAAVLGSRGHEPLTLSRNFLHAGSIEFLHPRTAERMSFSQPLPGDLQKFLVHLEGTQEH